MQGTIRALLMIVGVIVAAFWVALLEYFRASNAYVHHLLTPGASAAGLVKQSDMARTLYWQMVLCLGGIWSTLLVAAIVLSWRRRPPKV